MPDLSLKLVIAGSNNGAIDALNQVVQRAAASGNALQQADNAGSFSATKRGVTSISTQLESMKQAALTFMGIDWLVRMGSQAIAAADEMKGIDARIKLASKSWQDYAQTLAGVKQIAFEAGSALGTNVALVTKITEPIQRMGGVQADVLGIVQAVNNALRVTNGSAAETSAAILQFSQALGAGVLQGDELKSILENAPRLAQAIADGIGVSVSKLKDLGEQGALTSEQVFAALKSQQGKLEEEARKLPITVGQAWTNAGEGVKQYIAQIDQGTGATTALAAGINTIAKNIPGIVSGFMVIAAGAAAAFGARTVASLAASIAKTRASSQESNIAAQASLRQAETELAVAQAVAKKAAAELSAIKVVQTYTLATNEAATAELRRAAAAKMAAANQGVQNAMGGVVGASEAVKKTGDAVKAATAMGTAINLAKGAMTGLLGFFGGPLGLAVTAIFAGVTAWEMFGKKGKQAGEDARVPVEKLVKDFDEFAKKAGPAELEEQLGKLRDRAAELRDELQNPAFRSSKLGAAAQKDLSDLERAISSAERKIKQFNSERVVEKGQLGLDKLTAGAGGLIDKDYEKSLKAFSTLWTDFADKARVDAGKLKMTALEARAALQKMFEGAKTPADFSEVIARIQKAMTEVTLRADIRSTLKSYLENAIEQQFQAQLKQLDAMTAGMQAKAQRTQDLFKSQSDILLAQFSQERALAKMMAELKGDSGAASQIDIGSRNAEVSAAVIAANQKINALEQVAQRKRELVKEEQAAALAGASNEIAAATKTRDERVKAFEDEVAAGKRTAGQLKDYRKAQDDEFTKNTAGAIAQRTNAEQSAASQIAAIDGQTAQQRAAIADGLYKSLASKANEALNAYKSYAQQVLSLDKSIANNRLDTMSAIGAIQRQGLDGAGQLDSFRSELEQVKAAIADALKSGKNDFALELINRAKGIANSMSGVSGEGVDQGAVRQEAIDNIAALGDQAAGIMQKQKAEAEAAAKAQMEQYKQMTEAMTALAGQITKLNEQAAIKLKPEIDQASLTAAVDAVKAAFADVTVAVKVQGQPQTGNADSGQPVKTSDGTIIDSGQIPARAYGGELPGSAPHDRADNTLAWVTPGEWVIQRPAVRHYGSDFIAAVNAMRLPKYAFGGQIVGAAASRVSAIGNAGFGGSMIDRLRVPSLRSPLPSNGLSGLAAANFYLDGKKFPMHGQPDVVASLTKYFSWESFRKGGPR